MILFIAQGFGVGRIPKAPGTFGTLLGLPWFALLLLPGSLPVFIVGTILGLGLSVWCCGRAEKILGQSDPGSVVLDEITAMPVCFLPWLLWEISRHGTIPSAGYFFSDGNLLRTAGAFLLFRLFDIWKPWPVRQSQNLPGGWGVTTDDVLAAVYTGLAVLALVAL
jgi:phosphatidylglycerophosphatase A